MERLARGLRVSYLINFWVAVATCGLAGRLAAAAATEMQSHARLI